MKRSGILGEVEFGLRNTPFGLRWPWLTFWLYHWALTLSGLSFLICKIGLKAVQCLIRIVMRINDVVHIKCLVKNLPYSKHCGGVSGY